MKGKNYKAQIDRGEWLIELTELIKTVYDEGGECSDSTTRALLERDLGHTRVARYRVLGEMIDNAIHRATKVPLIVGKRDPTLLNLTQAMELLFNEVVIRLIPVMGTTKFVALLRELAHCLDDNEFDEYTIGSIMSKHTNYAPVICEWGDNF